MLLFEVLQPYLVVAVDVLVEIGTAEISAVLSLNEHLSKYFLRPTILLPVRVLFSYSVLFLSGYYVAANDFDEKQC
jgi:hypothetical protein